MLDLLPSIELNKSSKILPARDPSAVAVLKRHSVGRAQAQLLMTEQGIDLDRTERIANSLAHLACVCEQLQGVKNMPKVKKYQQQASVFLVSPYI